jgi:two-component system, OmpR family, sensor kinase
VASQGFSIRSAARATFSAYRSLPIRWRLAGGSAALTFVILAGFAAIVGVLTDRQVRGQFNDEVSRAADGLQQSMNGKLHFVEGISLSCNKAPRNLNDVASVEHAQIRVFADDQLRCTQDEVIKKGAKAPLVPSLFPTPPDVTTSHLFTQDGYRVAVRPLTISGPIHYDGSLLYARPLSDIDHTLSRVRFFLILGVFGGTVLALLAGLATAQRAMRPVVQLTDAARGIERTRDPSRRIPHPEADDEVAELARTLEGMLSALDAARTDTEAMLDRQREFVADASHELRTPLTSVLANLELLAEELDGEQADTAQAALRSTRRMRRLVGDLLLLARADAQRVQPHRSTDLGDVLTEAAGELGPVADAHDLAIEPNPVVVSGVRDDLHRLALNLLENALRHTPPGTHVRARTGTEDGYAVLIVEDDGPGIPPELQRRIFERFVRGGRDGGRGSGLGLAIVRAVAESHGGTVSLDQPGGVGTRFVIRIPFDRQPEAIAGNGNGAEDPTAQTSTTTGSTIGRRRNRS